MSDAKKTFKLSGWPISLVVFDRLEGTVIDPGHTPVQRYELEDGKMVFKGDYDYDNSRPSLVVECETALHASAQGLRLGQWTNQSYCTILSNRSTHSQLITTQNLRLALILKGINFNSHPKYYERNDLTLKGHIEDINDELANDAIMHALFYKGCNFSNKEGEKNYIMPFTAEELGCGRNELYVLFPSNDYSIPFPDGEEETQAFDFRKWMNTEVHLSKEAQAVYNAALDITRYYHTQDAYADGRNWNDSFYDIKNAIMNKDAAAYQTRNNANDRRITRVRTATEVRGFSPINIRKMTSEEFWPMFDRFFIAQRMLAEKINRELLEQNLMLWEHENIF